MSDEQKIEELENEIDSLKEDVGRLEKLLAEEERASNEYKNDRDARDQAMEEIEDITSKFI